MHTDSWIRRLPLVARCTFVFSGLIGLAWIWTIWCCGILFISDFEILLQRGAMIVHYNPGYQNTLYWVGPAPLNASTLWMPELERDAMKTLRSCIVPLWTLLTLFSLVTIIVGWRELRKIPPGHCPVCRYDLTGNTSGICPECGTPIAKSGAATNRS